MGGDEIINWLANTDNAFTIGAWSFVIGVFGTLISLLGFGITIWQLKKTRSSSEEAKIAVENLKSRVAIYDAVYEISKASSSIKETQRHLRIPNWESAVDSYTLAREAISKIIELPSKITTQDRESLKLALADIVSLCDKIEGGIIKSKVAVDRGKAIKTSREHADLVARIEIALQKEIKL